jgi:hypothetical protein
MMCEISTNKARAMQVAIAARREHHGRGRRVPRV